MAYLATAADDRQRTDVARALRYLARADARAVTAEAIHLDAEGVLDIEDGVSAIVLGLIEKGVVSINAAWPLLRLGDGNNTRVLRTAVETAHSRGETVGLMLGAYAAHLCREAWRAEGGSSVEAFLEWSSASFGSHPVVACVDAFLRGLRRLPSSTDEPRDEGGATRAGIRNPRWRSPRETADKRLAAVRSVLDESPTAALSALVALPATVLVDASSSVSVALIADLADALPSARLGALVNLVERIPAHGGAFQALA